MKIDFKASIRVVGTSYKITVPLSYVKNGLLDLNKEYWFSVDTERSLDNNNSNHTNGGSNNDA